MQPNRVHCIYNVAAQITQWEMIFHGTETPAQAGDPPTPERRGSISGQMGADGVTSYSSELDHNSLEFEASNSDQWRDVHKVRTAFWFEVDRV